MRVRELELQSDRRRILSTWRPANMEPQRLSGRAGRHAVSILALCPLFDLSARFRGDNSGSRPDCGAGRRAHLIYINFTHLWLRRMSPPPLRWVAPLRAIGRREFDFLASRSSRLHIESARLVARAQEARYRVLDSRPIWRQPSAHKCEWPEQAAELGLRFAIRHKRARGNSLIGMLLTARLVPLVVVVAMAVAAAAKSQQIEPAAPLDWRSRPDS